jgi:hypothetical protein
MFDGIDLVLRTESGPVSFIKHFSQILQNYLKYSLKIHNLVANHVSRNMSRGVTLYLIKLILISMII